MILLVTGGRSYADRARVFAELDKVHAETRIALLVHGACGVSLEGPVVRGCMGGADYLADFWARKHDVLVSFEPAMWGNGRHAGPERNAKMVRLTRIISEAFAHPALCLAFPGGSGTADCIRRARAAGIEVRIVESDK